VSAGKFGVRKRAFAFESGGEQPHSINRMMTVDGDGSSGRILTEKTLDKVILKI
jgi:hypothetical protein